MQLVHFIYIYKSVGRFCKGAKGRIQLWRNATVGWWPAESGEGVLGFIMQNELNPTQEGRSLHLGGVDHGMLFPKKTWELKERNQETSKITASLPQRWIVCPRCPGLVHGGAPPSQNCNWGDRPHRPSTLRFFSAQKLLGKLAFKKWFSNFWTIPMVGFIF